MLTSSCLYPPVSVWKLVCTVQQNISYIGNPKVNDNPILYVGYPATHEMGHKSDLRADIPTRDSK